MIVIVNNYKKNKSRQEETLKVIYQTQEKERLRIAQDLHDNLGAMLSTIKYYVTAMSSQSDTQKSEALNISALSHLDKALLDLRETVHDLIPKNIAENGWLGELNELLQNLKDNGSIDTNLEVEGEIPRYPAEIELSIFRIVQELINNSLKHAQAGKLNFLIHHHAGTMSIYYDDDGLGFDIKEAVKGYGLKNLNARTTLYGGFFDVKSEVGKGSFFKIIFDEKLMLKSK